MGYLFQAFGSRTTDASKVAFYKSLTVVIVPFLDKIIKGWQLTLYNELATLLSFAGVLLFQVGDGLANGVR